MDQSTINENIANQWLAAFNAHNIVSLLELYDETACHFSPKLKLQHPETQGLITGKPALQQWWQEAFKRLPMLKYTLTSLTANDKRVFMQYIRSVPSEDDMEVAEVLEIKDGKIIFSKVYHG